MHAKILVAMCLHCRSMDIDRACMWFIEEAGAFMCRACGLGVAAAGEQAAAAGSDVIRRGAFPCPKTSRRKYNPTAEDLSLCDLQLPCLCCAHALYIHLTCACVVLGSLFALADHIFTCQRALHGVSRVLTCLGLIVNHCISMCFFVAPKALSLTTPMSRRGAAAA